MLRKRSSRWARAKALYVLPLACLALGAFAQTSYVLPEDKTTKNSGNGEMPLPAGADGLTVGTPEGGMPPVEGSMAELLANLERTALEKQTAESGAHTFTGRVFGRDDKPWAGYEFICSGGRRVVTDAEGRFTIVSEKPIVCYLVGGETDRKVKSVGSRFGIPMETDIALEFHLKESLALTHLPVSDEPVVYAVYGDPADFRFDPEHPPLIMDGGEELSAETLDTYLGLPEQKMIGAWMVKGPEALKGYGTRAANGVLSIRVQTYPYTESWSPADPSLWDPEDLELYGRVKQLLETMQKDSRYGIERIFTKEEAEKEHLDGTFSFILEALDGVSFGDEFHSPLVAPFETKDYRYGHATHGYLPEKGPQPVFYAKGPDFREHVMLEHARLVDEAPTFAELLGLEFPNVQGSCLWELLKKDHSGRKKQL